MGYEQKFYIVVDHPTMKGLGECKDRTWAEVIAMYDYSKDNDFAGFIDRNGVDTDCYIYADDGNTEVYEDSCGEIMKEIEILDILQYLKNKNTDYRRHAPFVALLESFYNNKDRFPGLKILRYGH